MSDQSYPYQLSDLLYLMARLRDPSTGCPWDVKQTFATIVPSTLEEAYEVADAIENGDYDHLKEELGDLLFQVVFYAQLGKEQGYFDFEGLVSALTGKLISRHPHVFPNGDLSESSEMDARVDVKAQWEQIKADERAKKGRAGPLADVPLALPSVTRAQKLQKRAGNVGFDFQTLAAAMEKVREELAEVETELSTLLALENARGLGAPVNDGQDQQKAEVEKALGEELGDLLFSVVNVCRIGKYDAEGLLRATNRKFESRFNQMADELSRSGKSLEAASLDEMEAAWQSAKRKPVA